MSNKNCKELGYEVGDEFEIIEGFGSYGYRKGDIVTLTEDDGTTAPYFNHDKYINLDALKPLKPKQFTKSMLESGKHVVELRGGCDYSGGRYLVVGDKVLKLDDFICVGSFTDKLQYETDSSFDVIKVYEVDNPTNLDLTTWKLTLVWERDEKSQEQLERETQLKELQTTIEKAQEQIKLLQEGV